MFFSRLQKDGLRLEKGAKLSDFAKLHAIIGDTPLPTEFVELYSKHNGGDAGYSKSGVHWLSIEQIIEEWESWMEVVEERKSVIIGGHHSSCVREYCGGDNRIKFEWFDPKWLPITNIDGTRECLLLDLNPGQNGKIGQVLQFNCEGCCATFYADSIETAIIELIEQNNEDSTNEENDNDIEIIMDE